MNSQDMLKKSQNAEPFTKEELVSMLNVAPDSREAYQIMAESRRISDELTEKKVEIHAQLALNLAPCSANCKFCAFAAVNKIFSEPVKLSTEEAVLQAKGFEKQGANAIYIMTTATYDFDEFLEISQEIRQNLQPETVLIANVGDKNLTDARKLKDTGYQGVYHALRLREGKDTGLKPEKRIESIRIFQEAGLKVGTCVEPVGPEHTNEELAEMILYTASVHPAYSGSARRITVPTSDLVVYGMISELRMAQIVAITRLAVPRTVKGNCTHEPCTLGALSGANLLWAEVGANPRDVKKKTEEGRGHNIEQCRNIYQEVDCNVLLGPSAFFQEN